MSTVIEPHITEVEKTLEEVETVTIRFAGDSGDGMQLTGTQFTNTSAVVGNDISTLPTTADVLVNCVPVNCMPSPESPAKRIVTASTSSRLLSACSTGGSIIVLILCLGASFRMKSKW